MNDLQKLVENGFFMSLSQGRRAICEGRVKIDGVEVVNMDSQLLVPGTHRVEVGRKVDREVTIQPSKTDPHMSCLSNGKTEKPSVALCSKCDIYGFCSSAKSRKQKETP